MAERQFGPYRLVRQIAVGGMAEIHLAKTKGIAGFEKYVALKMIHPNFAEDDQFIQMLVDEAKIAVQLNHGNIAQTFDLGRVGETFYITMEYVDGADLYKLLRRGSEIDLEMPLDVCAFVVKEVASALDHAHRKRDHNNKSLGIVHRDVSPQNVLISYAGEVKLVDFGIAKATMKARQTAVGVIKGKYYYMSPEQAWGDPIDFRSDIFSAGIVLYEMLTGQMLYLEEDLHKLLDMARRADIASPSTLRKGIPPQLERIVMHALAKVPGERYQNAGDFATDLERFLHTYSPVFTAGKVAALMRKIVGDPLEVPDTGEAPDIEIREGPIATHTLNTEDLVHSSDELRDENSMIFSVDQLQGAPAGPRITRQAELPDLVPPKPLAKQVVKPPTPAAGSRALPRAPTRPRDKNEMTREVPPAPPGGEESGLLDVKTPPTPWQDSSTHTEAEELENVGERTMVTGAPGGGFMMDVATEDGVDATIVGGAPPIPEPDDSDDDLEDQETLTGQRPVRREDGEDGVTTTRDFRDGQQPRAAGQRGGPAPPALAAKIHAPAVSELRKPRASRKTPSSGSTTPPPNVLQQIVGAQVSEPMPAPRAQAPTQPPPLPVRTPEPMPQPPFGSYAAGADASGLPLTTPPPGIPAQMIPGVPPHLQPYALQQGYPPTYPPPYQNYQQLNPNALYPLQPYGSAPPQPMSLTGQMRLFEADELPSQYKVSGNASRWVMIVLAGIVAVSVAAGVTFFIIRSTRNGTPTTGSIHVESVPPGGDIFLDGTHVAGVTPQTLPFELQAGTRHEIRVELAKHKPHVENVDIPSDGGEVAINALMDPITGRLRVVTTPAGADVIIDGTLRGRTNTTINDIDMASAKHLELRLKEYSPYIQTLTWPANGEIDIDQKLAH